MDWYFKIILTISQRYGDVTKKNGGSKKSSIGRKTVKIIPRGLTNDGKW